MKHIQNFSGFLTSSFGDLNEAKGEKITSAEIEKLVGMKATEEDYELDPEDVYKSVQSFVLENPAIDEDSPLYINIYDGDSFAFFVGSSPIALSIHSPAEKRSIQTTMVEIPAPLSKLDKAIVDEAVNVAIENSWRNIYNTGPNGLDGHSSSLNAGGLRWKDLNHLSNTTGNSFVDAEGNLVLDGLAVEFAEVAMAA